MSIKSKKEAELTLGLLIDSDIEFFKEHLKDKNIGYVLSLKNLLSATYADLVDRKSRVLVKREHFLKHNDTESAEGCQILVQQLYSKMQSVEDRYLYAKELSESLQIKESGN